MPRLQFDRHVAHPPDAMFSLVSDLDAYPRFIPNCKSMVAKKDSGTQGDVRFARMTLSFGPITQGYTSRVTLDAAALTIDAKATDGPFQYLISQWRFEPEASGTKVHFEVDFKISNPLLAAVAEPAFAAKQREIMDAFIAEADRRYLA
jgi:coenzyme Q-binding protein COQ10